MSACSQHRLCPRASGGGPQVSQRCRAKAAVARAVGITVRPSASSSADVQVSYGGWTPIYSPGIRPIEYRPEEVALQPQVEKQVSSEAAKVAKPEPSAAPVRAAVPAPAAPAQGSAEESQELNDFDLQNLEFGNIFGDFGGGFGALGANAASSRSSTEDDGVGEESADAFAAASSSDGAEPRVVILNATEGDESVLAAADEEAEERADHGVEEEVDEHDSGEPESIPQVSSSVKSGGQGKRKAKQESSFTVTQTETEELSGSATDKEAAPVGTPSRGRGQGRFVGRVLPASVFDDDAMSAGSDGPLMAAPVRWRQIVAEYQQEPLLPSSQSSIGYTLRFNESR